VTAISIHYDKFVTSTPRAGRHFAHNYVRLRLSAIAAVGKGTDSYKARRVLVGCTSDAGRKRLLRHIASFVKQVSDPKLLQPGIDFRIITQHSLPLGRSVRFWNSFPAGITVLVCSLGLYPAGRSVESLPEWSVLLSVRIREAGLGTTPPYHPTIPRDPCIPKQLGLFALQGLASRDS